MENFWVIHEVDGLEKQENPTDSDPYSCTR